MFDFYPNDDIFEIWRGGVKLGLLHGHRFNDNKNMIIDFHTLVDVKQYDIIVTPENASRYIVVDVQNHQPTLGYANRYFNAYIVPEPLISPTKQLCIDTIRSEIENCEQSDKDTVRELISLLQRIADNTTPPKQGIFHKFSNVICKYAPIATSVGQLLLQCFL